MRNVRSIVVIAIFALGGGCATSGITVKDNGTVYVVRGGTIYTCTQADAGKLDCTQSATLP